MNLLVRAEREAFIDVNMSRIYYDEDSNSWQLLVLM